MGEGGCDRAAEVACQAGVIARAEYEQVGLLRGLAEHVAGVAPADHPVERPLGEPGMIGDGADGLVEQVDGRWWIVRID